jgi:lipid-binding SYLF domain-containing protein
MLFVITGCSTMTVTEKDQKRSELDAMAETAIAGLIEQDANVKTEMDKSVGYAVANMKVTKVPIIGAGGGEGVLVDKKTNKRTYFTVSRLDIGGGWGARSYKVLIVINTQEILDRLDKDTWEFQAGVEASVGKAAAEGSSSDLNEGFSVHVLSDGGASATVTARVIRMKVNSELTDN